MNEKTIIPTYHVLLIGIDKYPDGYNSLHGCVNDIDAIEQLLLAPPGIGIPAEQIQITRLAAAHPSYPSTSRFKEETLKPTKDNIIQTLKTLAGSVVKSFDRVLIYYSGHGDEKKCTGSTFWHEALVPYNNQKIEYLFDVEINALINAIAARTNDLTIVFDCCHSAGATRDLRDIHAEGAVRTLNGEPTIEALPDLAALGLDCETMQDRVVGTHLLQSTDPSYLVVVACQSDEKASEGAPSPGQPVHGVFTHSLLAVLSEKDAKEHASLRWSDIWSNLLAKAAERNALLRQRTQHPWMIGRSERKVFGGPWEKMDAGYRVRKRPNDDYEIGAGRLMGVTVGAEVAVYGPEPRMFPSLGSKEDHPVGSLKVIQSGPSNAIGSAINATFSLPDGARGRLIKPGESQRLRVSLKSEDTALKVCLEESPLLEIVSASYSDADVEVITQSGGGWIIGNDTEPLLAIIPPDETQALRAGLEHCYYYNSVLRMAHNCNDPHLSNSLKLHLLDCNDEEVLNAMLQEEPTDLNFPEAPRDSDRIYFLEQGFRFCVKVTNNSQYHLNVTFLNCTAGGMIEYLSDTLLRNGATHIIWLDNKLGTPFKAGLDELPIGVSGISPQDYATDRMIAIGTTRSDINLDYLRLDNRVQEVVDKNLSINSDREFMNDKSIRDSEKTSTAPAELWTATLTPIRIAR